MPDGQPSTDVSLRCCATVSQSTGEDWNNTTLTLRTATVQIIQNSLFVPSITPLRIRLSYVTLARHLDVVCRRLLLPRGGANLFYLSFGHWSMSS